MRDRRDRARRAMALVIVGGMVMALSLGVVASKLTSVHANAFVPKDPPGGVRYALIVWDAADGYWLTFGGTNDSRSTCPAVNYTWTYAAGTWTNITAHSGFAMPKASAQRFFYDPVGARVVIFGGFIDSGATCAFRQSGYTWAFKAGLWSNLTGTAGALPLGVGFGATSYQSEWGDWDTTDNYGYLYAWAGAATGYALDYKFSGTGVWSNITATVTGFQPHDYNNIESWDGQNNKFILAGGINWTSTSYESQTYAYVGGVWTHFAGPPYPTDHSRGGSSLPFVGYDPRDNYLIQAFGASATATTALYNYTYKLVGTTWTNISPANAPPPRQNTGWEGNGTAMAAWGGSATVALTSELNFPTYLYFFYNGNWSQAPFCANCTTVAGGISAATSAVVGIAVILFLGTLTLAVFGIMRKAE